MHARAAVPLCACAHGPPSLSVPSQTCVRQAVQVPDSLLAPVQLVQVHGGAGVELSEPEAPRPAAAPSDASDGDIMLLPPSGSPSRAATPKQTGTAATSTPHLGNAPLQAQAAEGVRVYHRITVRVERETEKHLHALVRFLLAAATTQCPHSHRCAAAQDKASDVLASYDLVAVEAHSVAAWEAAISSGSVDILTLPWTEKLPFPLTKARLDAARAAGIVLEVPFAAALRHATLRRFFVANVSDLHRQLRGRVGRGALMLTSGAESHTLMRSPHDAAALVAGLTSLPRSAALQALSRGPAAALRHAAERRSVAGVSVRLSTTPAAARLPTPLARGRQVHSEAQASGMKGLISSHGKRRSRAGAGPTQAQRAAASAQAMAVVGAGAASHRAAATVATGLDSLAARAKRARGL